MACFDPQGWGSNFPPTKIFSVWSGAKGRSFEGDNGQSGSERMRKKRTKVEKKRQNCIKRTKMDHACDELRCCRRVISYKDAVQRNATRSSATCQARATRKEGCSGEATRGLRDSIDRRSKTQDQNANTRESGTWCEGGRECDGHVHDATAHRLFFLGNERVSCWECWAAGGDRWR